MVFYYIIESAHRRINLSLGGIGEAKNLVSAEIIYFASVAQ